MIVIKGMELQTDCKKCPLMATDGLDTLSPMMCFALWATKHKVKHCIEGKILDDCPLAEIVTCKDCIHWDKSWISRVQYAKEYHYCPMANSNTSEDYFCANAERR